MVTKLFGVACAVGLTANAAWAQNVVFRCVDEAGRAQYTNVQSDTSGRQCQVVQREISVVPPQAAAAPKPAAPVSSSAAPRPVPGPLAATNPSFPRVDGPTQRGRDDTRRKVLEDELSQEERMLTKAREDLSEQDKIRNGDERNYQRVLDRLKPYQDAVERHTKNIDALRRELASVR
jgi:Domain of unknown function (DUF4124)